MTTLTFTIPPSLWLTSNRAPHNRGHRSRQVADLQATAALIARTQGATPIVGPVVAAWEVRYPKGVRTDKGESSNAQPTTKALLDGIVQAGILVDDGPKFVTSETFHRGPNLTVASLHEITLTLTPQERP